MLANRDISTEVQDDISASSLEAQTTSELEKNPIETLTKAIDQNDHEKVAQLSQHSGDLCATGDTCLIYAVRKRCKECVQLLAKYGAGKRNKDGQNAAHVAYDMDCVPLLKILVPLEVALQDSNGQTLHERALADGRFDVIQLVKQSTGESMAKKTTALTGKLGTRALKVQVGKMKQTVQCNVIDALELSIPVEPSISSEVSSAESTAQEAPLPEVFECTNAPRPDPPRVCRKPSVLELTFRPTTDLMRACIEDLPEVVLLLEQAGQLDNDGRAALQYASYYGAEHAVRALLPLEKEIIVADKMTPLHYAALGNKLKSHVNLLAKLYAGKRDHKGRTATMLAAQHAKNTFLHYLVSKAPIELGEKDITGQTALQLAASCGNIKGTALLARQEAKVSGITQLMLAAFFGTVEVVREKIPNQGLLRDNAGRTALMYAALGGQLEAAKMLAPLECGAVDMFGDSAALMAARINSLPLFEYLQRWEEPHVTMSRLIEEKMFSAATVLSAIQIKSYTSKCPHVVKDTIARLTSTKSQQKEQAQEL